MNLEKGGAFVLLFILDEMYIKGEFEILIFLQFLLLLKHAPISGSVNFVKDAGQQLDQF